MQTDRTRLDQAMDERRVELRMTWREVADAAELSLAGLGAIRRGERNPTALTQARIEDALQWSPGTVDSILAGGEPTEAGRSRELPDSFEERKRALMEVLAPEEARLLEVAIEMIERDRERRREARDQKVRRGRTSA